MDPDEALGAVLATAGDRLLRFAYQLCHDRAGAEDLVQQALERTYRRLRSGAEIEQLEAYVRKAVVNEFLSRRRLRSATEIVTDEVPELALMPVDSAARLTLWDAVGALPERQRAAIVARFCLDLPDAETAALLDCRESTVRSLVRRGLVALRGDSVLTEEVPR